MTTTQIDTTAVARHQGLSEEEAAARRARGEGNVVEFETSRSYRQIIRENAVSFINILLFVISTILIVLGLYSDAVMTAGLVVFNIAAGVIQEARAKRQLDRIALLHRPTATVIRGGQERQLNPAELVRGDLLALHPGDQVVVDGVLVESGHLELDESLLTGESDRVPKQAGDTVLSGSFCVNGNGVFEASRVGHKSLAQQITAGARVFRQVRTPLQRDVRLIIQAAAVAIVLLSILVAFNFHDIYQTLPLVESVRAAAVIVAIVPQGLYLMVGVTYAMAAVRMVGKGALIQRTNAVESMSHIDILCMDKTGTLTTNRLGLAELLPATGVTETRLRELLGIYAASTVGGNRTIEAMRASCGGLAHDMSGEVPFSSERKWSALTFSDELNGIYVLGAPEMILPHVTSSSGVEERLAGWTHQGLRGLVFARGPLYSPVGARSESPALPDGLELLGALSFRDELRPEAQSTIQGFAALGIQMKIISGDNPDTVASLARQAGIAGSDRVISGLQLDGLNDLEFQQVAEDVTVFGRVTPQQKERLITSLRGGGHYVAMIGDGVNDILALKQSQLAIAMRSGSQATRGIADLVLLDDSYAVLPQLFREGQRILTGMQDIIRLFLVRTLEVVFIVCGTSLIGERFPILPQHNGLLAFLTVGIPSFALAVWAKPGTPVKSLLRLAAPFVIPAAFSISVVAVAVYAFYASLTQDVTLARTALTTVSVFCGILLIPFLEPPTEAWTGGNTFNGDWRPTILAGAMFGLYALFVITPVTRHFFQVETLSISAFIVIGFVVVGWASAIRFVWRLKLFERLDQLRHEVRRRFRRGAA